VPIQVFVDESETFSGSAPKRHFVMAGLIGHSADWANFSDDWDRCCKRAPAIKYLKMSEAASFAGQFFQMPVTDRESKLISLAKIINKYAKIVTWSVFDLDAFDEVREPQPGPRHTKNYYFWPFQNSILSAGFTLWDAQWRDVFEIIFDEHVIFGPRAKVWYPVIRHMVKLKYPDEYSIFPVEPIFKRDDDSLPLQAADLFAWCIRNATDDPQNTQFEWLLPYMSNVSQKPYSQYYDAARLRTIDGLSLGMLRNDPHTKVIFDEYRPMFETKKHRKKS
jgi:hypothetical protein